MRRTRDVALFVMLVVFAMAFVAGLMRAPDARGANGQLGPVGQGSANFYAADTQTGAFRSTLGAADSQSVATLTSTTTAAGLFPAEFVIGKAGVGCRSNVTVWGHFSNAGQTCQVALLYIDRDSAGVLSAIPGPSGTLTLTAGGWTDSGGKFISPAQIFDSAAATGCIPVLVTAPAAGTVDLYVGSS